MTDTFRQRYNISRHEKISVQANHLKKEAKNLQKIVTALEKDIRFLQQTGDINMMLSALGYL
jgi:archaellum component FlaC